MQRKLLGLLFAAAAYGIYKYTRMTAEEKENLKRKGGDLLKDLAGAGNHPGEKRMATVSTENNY
jgi:hypothetical protein